MTYIHVRLSDLAKLSPPGPVAEPFVGLPDAALADVSWVGEPLTATYVGTGFWPVVPVEAAHDPLTHRLGALVVGQPDRITRTVPATYALVTLPVPDAPSNSDWRTALILWGRFDDIEAQVIAAHESKTVPGKIVWQRWEYANNVYRAELMQLRASFGFSEAEVDESLWRASRVAAGDLSGQWPLPASTMTGA